MNPFKTQFKCFQVGRWKKRQLWTHNLKLHDEYKTLKMVLKMIILTKFTCTI